MVKSQPVLALLVFLFYFQLTFSLRIGRIGFDKLYVCFRSSAGESDRLLSGRPGVRITSGTLHVPETYASFPALYVYKEESQ